MGGRAVDPFGTASVRERVLAAWTASPTRFREDANAEEELVRGAYRDRLVVELAQNAADAAVRGGVPGRLLLRLEGSTLVAANVGAPLDAAGVEGLSTLRASAKRDDPAATVGRFGVGFAATLAVTDAPTVVSRSGGVRWSRPSTLEAVAGIPVLAAEVARRGDAVPVLRLPFPAEGTVPEPYDTVVSLTLRDQRAVALVAELLADIDDALLLALPALVEITVEVGDARRTLTAERAGPDVTVDDNGRRARWHLERRTGPIAPDLLADRPVEERARPHWEVTVAVPVDDSGAPVALPASVPRVVHAPTPTDEPTALPALVMATFPLDSSRRRVAPGPLADLVVREIAVAYAALAAQLAGPAVLGLVPGPLGSGELDAALHRAVVDALARTPLVPAADGSGRLRPDRVVLVPGLERAADPAALAQVVAGLPAAAWWRPDALRRLGAQEVPLADVVDRLAELSLPPAEWRALYGALEGSDPEVLAGLPVPLADGRVVRGPRGVLVPTGEVGPRMLEPLGLRVAHPDADHPVLHRLGAVEATPAAVLRDPAARGAVEALAADDAAAEAVPELVDAVLGLVAASGVTVEDEPWLGRLPLPDASGQVAPAQELLLPGSPTLDLLDADPAEYTVAAEPVDRWGEPVLRAVGVRDGFGVVRDADVALDDESRHDLDDEDRWAEAVLAGLPGRDLPPMIVELIAVRDLDLVREDAWPAALALLAGDPATRPALVEPAYALLADGTRRTVVPYTVWWLRTHARISGLALEELCSADAEPLVRALLHPADLGLDEAVTRSLGMPTTLTDLDTGLLLDRLADPGRTLSARDLADVYAVLASTDTGMVPAPRRIRVPAGLGSRVVPAADAVVADGPHWLQLDLPAVVPGGRALADLLDVDLAADVYDGAPGPGGVVTQVPEAVSALVPDAPTTYVEHDDLVVADRAVDWWVDGENTVHAATPDGLARGLAWATGHWELRFLLAEALRDPAAVPALLSEQAYEPHRG